MTLDRDKLRACDILRRLLNGEIFEVEGINVRWIAEGASFEENNKIKIAEKTGIYRCVPVVTPKRHHKYNKWVFLDISLSDFVQSCSL
ncbi:MAG: hypothetical protein QXN55_00890 [Candidatus Nitrosotenuis sp.]